VILKAHHVRAAGLCVWGLRAWCRSNTVDMRRLCRDGIPIDERPDLHGDPLVQRAIAVAAREASND